MMKLKRKLKPPEREASSWGDVGRERRRKAATPA
jgi:hypothetical protein